MTYSKFIVCVINEQNIQQVTPLEAKQSSARMARGRRPHGVDLAHGLDIAPTEPP